MKRAKNLEIAKSNDKFTRALNENPDPLILAEWKEEEKSGRRRRGPAFKNFVCSSS